MKNLKNKINNDSSENLQDPGIHFDVSKIDSVLGNAKMVDKKKTMDDGLTSGVVMKLTNVNKFFKVGDQDIHILKDVNATIKEMEFCIIFGPSGSGKSTMLHTLLGLEPPTSGNVYLMKSDMAQMDADTAAVFRTTRIGMVYQQPNWVKSLTVIENVAFPMYLLGYMPSEAAIKAMQMLELVGMTEWRDHMPTELSAGQQQRISLARALINDPIVIVADEPTGNLDTQSGEELMYLLSRLNKEHRRTVVMVTHDLEYLKYATRVVRLVDGQVMDEYAGADIDELRKKIVGKRGGKGIQELEMSGDKHKSIGQSEAMTKVFGNSMKKQENRIELKEKEDKHE